MRNFVQVTTPATVFDLTTVEDANEYLGLTPSTDGDMILAAQITAASQIIASQCDRIFAKEDVVQTFVMRYGEGIQSLVLERIPVVSIASVNDNGHALSSSDYDYDPVKGILWRSCTFIDWAWWSFYSSRVAVTYSGGYDLPDGAPADLEMACLALIKEQRFAQKRGDPTIRSLQHADSAVFYQQGSQAFAIGQGALPPSVQQLIQPYKLPAMGYA
jgi:hypothetical protein